MKEYYEIKEMLCKELKEYAHKGELSAGSLDVIHKLTDTIKNIDKIEMLEESEYYDEDSYEGGGSYARGRGRNVKRDRMGRYSRDGEGGEYGRGGSYTRGGGYGRNNGMMYSRDDGKEEIIQNVRDMMKYAKNEHEREAFRRVLEELEDD